MKCPCCKNETIDNYIQEFEIYKLYKCNGCYVEFWEPRSVDSSFYEDENLSASKTLHESVEIKIANWHETFFNDFDINSLNKNSKVLDLGCTNGALLAYMRDKKECNYFGVDFDSKSTQVAKEFFKHENIYNMDFDSFFDKCKKDNIKFDLIMAFEIIEHVDDCLKFITDIHELLNDNGVFVESVPNRDRLFANLNRDVEEFDWPPHHLTWFDKKSLKNLLQLSGFKHPIFKPVVKKFQYFIPLIEHSLIGKYTIKYKKILNSEEPLNKIVDVSPKISLKNKILKLIRFLLFSPFLILYPIYLIKGDSIYFQVKKS